MAPEQHEHAFDFWIGEWEVHDPDRTRAEERPDRVGPDPRALRIVHLPLADPEVEGVLVLLRGHARTMPMGSVVRQIRPGLVTCL
jgi:hypothetical protein